MTADKISLLYFFAILDELRTNRLYAGVVEGRHERDDQVHVWAEVLQGCSWDQGQHFLHSLFLHKPLHFLITKNQGKFTGILPWQKAVGGKGQKGLWWDFVNNLQCTDGSHSWHCWSWKLFHSRGGWQAEAFCMMLIASLTGKLIEAWL